MKRQLLLATSCIILLAGWMSAFLPRYIFHASEYAILLPTLLLGVGMGLTLKLLSGPRTALVLALTAVVSLFAINQLYPDSSLSFRGFGKRFQQNMQAGHLVEVQVRDTDRVDAFAQPRQLRSVADVSVNLFARVPGAPRMLALDTQGALYVSIPDLGAIYKLIDNDGNGYAEQPLLFHVDMDRPHGLLWYGDKLYVAETSRLLELQDTDGDQQADRVRTVLDGLPDDGGHWTRSLAMDKNGMLYLSIGSRCNACEEPDQRRATVMRVEPKTGHSEIYARGLRNTVGMAFAADGQTLWGSDNGRDMLGDNLPPDEINRLVAGGDYGWPYCFGQQIADPELGEPGKCQGTIAAAVDIPAHSAPLGIAFGDKLTAPQPYRQSLYVALHGSWNRSTPTGYKLVRIPFAGGAPAGPPEDVLSGWLADGHAWGRPVAPLVGPDGNLYLSDDRANAIYRIVWNRQEH